MRIDTYKNVLTNALGTRLIVIRNEAIIAVFPFLMSMVKSRNFAYHIHKEPYS